MSRALAWMWLYSASVVSASLSYTKSSGADTCPPSRLSHVHSSRQAGMACLYSTKTMRTISPRHPTYPLYILRTGGGQSRIPTESRRNRLVLLPAMKEDRSASSRKGDSPPTMMKHIEISAAAHRGYGWGNIPMRAAWMVVNGRS